MVARDSEHFATKWRDGTFPRPVGVGDVDNENGIYWEVGFAYEKAAKLFGVPGTKINMVLSTPPIDRSSPKHARCEVAQLIHVSILECAAIEILARLTATKGRRMLEHGLQAELPLAPEPVLRNPLLTIPIEPLFTISA